MLQVQPKPHVEELHTDFLSGNENIETEVSSEVELEIDMEVSEIPKDTQSEVKIEKENEIVRSGAEVKRTSSSATLPSNKASSSVNKTAVSSKPLTKSASVRNPSNGATASSLGRNKSVHSVGGSGDEKRKALASATRRSSLALVSQQTTLKPESLADKRGASKVNIRKPLTSANPTSVKSVTKPINASTTTKLAGNRSSTSAAIVKPISAGTSSDTKKRLSTSSGPTSTTKPLSRAPTTSTSSKEVDELKIKLAANEAVIEEQKTQIAATSEKFDELKSKLEASEDVVQKQKEQVNAANQKIDELKNRLEEETQKFILTENKVKTEHKNLVDNLYSTHQHELKQLQAEVDNARSAVLIAEESLKKSIEEAQQTEASKNAEVIQNLKKEHEASITELNTQLATIQAAYSSSSATISEMESKIVLLESEILKSAEECESLKLENQKSITTLKIEYEERLAKNSEELQSIENKTADINQELTTEVNSLKSKLNNALSALESEASQSKTYESQVKEFSEKNLELQNEISEIRSEARIKSENLIKSSDDIKSLNEKYESSRKEVEVARGELGPLMKKYSSLEEMHSKNLQELNILRDEFDQVKAQLDSQKKMMATFDADGKSKDEFHSKTQATLDETTKLFEEKKAEIVHLQKNHSDDLQKLYSEHKTEIDTLKENYISREKYDSLKKESEESSGNLKDLLHDQQIEFEKTLESHLAEISLLKNRNLELEKKIQDPKLIHKNILGETTESFHVKNVSDSARQNCPQSSEIHDVSAQQNQIESVSKTSSTTQTSQDAEISLQEKLAKLTSDLEMTKNELQNTQQLLANEKLEKTCALADLETVMNKNLGSFKAENHKTVLPDSNNQPHEYSKSEENLQTKKDLIKLEEVVASQEIGSKAPGSEFLKAKEVESAEVKNASPFFTDESTNKKTLEEEIKYNGTEGEQDDSSAALSSIAQARVTAQQLTQLNDELLDQNFSSMHCLTEVLTPVISHEHEKFNETTLIEHDTL